LNALPRITGLIAAQAQAQRARLRLAAAGGAVVSVSAVCLLGLSGWFITGAAFAGAAGAPAAQSFNYMMPSAIIRLLAILRTGGRYVERVAGHEAALKALARLRPQLFDAIAASPVEGALSLSSGEVSARLVQDVDAVQTLFVRRSAPWSLAAGATAAVLMASRAESMPEQYKGYLIPNLRESFDLPGTPIRLTVKSSAGDNPYAPGGAKSGPERYKGDAKTAPRRVIKKAEKEAMLSNLPGTALEQKKTRKVQPRIISGVKASSATKAGSSVAVQKGARGGARQVSRSGRVRTGQKHAPKK
jgi:hypothetical protein